QLHPALYAERDAILTKAEASKTDARYSALDRFHAIAVARVNFISACYSVGLIGRDEYRALRDTIIQEMTECGDALIQEPPAAQEEWLANSKPRTILDGTAFRRRPLRRAPARVGRLAPRPARRCWLANGVGRRTRAPDDDAGAGDS